MGPGPPGPTRTDDGNELAGIRVPEVSFPLATTTGWNFRAERIGNPSTVYALLGSYVGFARTRAEREARHDPRKSVEERYSSRDDYLKRIRDAANALVKERFLLAEDVEDVVQRAAAESTTSPSMWPAKIGRSRP